MSLFTTKDAIIGLGESMSSNNKSAWIEIIEQAKVHNPWFTEDNIHACLDSWSEQLTTQNMEEWLKNQAYSKSGKEIGIIAAGNIHGRSP